jgi:hypothetical protein
MDHFILEPDADFQGTLREVGDQVEFDIFAVRNIRHLDFVVEE